MLDNQFMVGPSYTVYLLYGIPGAGKSTVAQLLQKRMSCPVVSFDDFWQKFDIVPSQATGSEKFQVYSAAIMSTLHFLQRGDVIVDCTSRSLAFRRYATSLFCALGSSVVYVDCRASALVTRRRVASRWLFDLSHRSKGTGHFDAILRTFDPLGPLDYECTVATIDTSNASPRLVEVEGSDAQSAVKNISSALERTNFEVFVLSIRQLLVNLFGQGIEYIEDRVGKNKSKL